MPRRLTVLATTRVPLPPTPPMATSPFRIYSCASLANSPNPECLPRGAPVLALNLAGMREEVMLYRELATLRTDVPLTESVADLRWCGADFERLRQVCEDLGDRSLVERARSTPVPGT